MGGLSRRKKESRAYTLTLVGGGSGIGAVVLFVLGIFGIGSIGLAFLLALVAVACFFMFKKTVD